MAKHKWTQWYKFSDIFEHHGWVADNSQSGYKITVSGKTSKLHTDGGFRLKSLKKGSLGEYHEASDERSCPLKNGDLGLYWIHIKSSNGIASKDYIGMSAEFKQGGIIERLIDHFQKLTVLPSRAKIKKYRKNLEQLVKLDSGWDLGTYNSIVDVRSAFRIEVDAKDKRWKETHELYMKQGVDLYTKFNDDHISICFYKIERPEQMESANKKAMKSIIEQAEARAHLNFKNEFGPELSLNTRYEGYKYKGNPSLIMTGFSDRLKEKYDENVPLDIFKSRVDNLSDHAKSIFKYLELKKYEISSDLLMHIISDGSDMRFSAPPYNARGRAVRRLGYGVMRRNIIVLIPKIRSREFLFRSYLEPNDLKGIVNNVVETPDGEPLNSEFFLDKNISIDVLEDVMRLVLMKWKKSF